MKTLITCIVFFFWASLSSAEAQYMQNRGMNAPGIHQIIIQHGEALNLTNDQKQQLIEIQYKWRSDMRTAHWNVRGRGGVLSPRRADTRVYAVPRRIHHMRAYGYGAPGAGYSRGVAWQQYLFTDRTAEVFEILTEEQISKLQTIRVDYIERQHEYRTLRNQTLIERTDIDSEKAGDVLELMNQISEYQKQMQTERIENPGVWDTDAFRNHYVEISTVHNKLRNLLTVAEYELLMPAGMMGRHVPRGNKASGRTFMRCW